MDLLAWESLVLQSTGSSTTICHKISRSVFQLHGLLWLSNNTSVRENRWCAGPNQQPRETNGRVSPNICFPFPGFMQRMALSMYYFHRYFFWPDVLDGLKEMFTRTQFVCDQGGYFPEIKVDFSSWTWSTCHVTPFSNQAHPERFIMKRRPEFRDWLKMLRQNGKFLYVITGETHRAVSSNDTTINLRQSCWLCLPCCVVRPGRRLVSKHSVCLRCFWRFELLRQKFCQYLDCLRCLRSL